MAESIPKTALIKSQKTQKDPNMMPLNKVNSLIVLQIQREIESKRSGKIPVSHKEDIFKISSN